MSDKPKHAGGRPPKYTNVDDLQVLIDKYFETDAYLGEGDNRMYAPTMGGLAYALDLSRQSLLNYANKDEFLDAIKRARTKVGMALEQRLYSNNVAGIIFNLKNNFDWKDKKEISGQVHVTTEQWLNDLE